MFDEIKKRLVTMLILGTTAIICVMIVWPVAVSIITGLLELSSGQS